MGSLGLFRVVVFQALIETCSESGRRVNARGQGKAVTKGTTNISGTSKLWVSLYGWC
jgi:hypothetical protein